MITYLSGCMHRNLDSRVGYILTPNMGNRPDLSRRSWAADNGCFSQGDRFSLDDYLAWLKSVEHYQPTCLFATAPDVVADAAATWKRSREVLPLLRGMGWRAALVAQDGMESLDVAWDAFDCLFVGGSTAWKVGGAAAALCSEARALGLHVHMGRVNSLKRLRYAESIGCHSCDGTTLPFFSLLSGFSGAMA